VYSRRFDDHVRNLCAKVAKASEGEMPSAVTELQTALREYILQVENKAIKDLLKGMGKPDRRDRNGAVLGTRQGENLNV